MSIPRRSVINISPVQKAIADAMRGIPPQVMKAAFFPKQEFGRVAPIATIESMVREQIVESRVMEDCNLTGGTQLVVPLDGLVQEYHNQATLIVQIPLERTGYRRITRCTSLLIGLETLPSSFNYGMTGYSAMTAAGAQVMASHMPMPIQSTARITLIAENTIMISDQSILPSAMQLLCYVENDLDFTTMRSMTISKFAKLVEFAIKAHIYNELIIPMAEGEMRGGMDLGKFKEIVDGYADANQNYQDYLESVWIKVQHMDDFNSRNRHLRLIMGGSH